MADPRNVAIRRQNAEVRLWKLVRAAAVAHGLSYREPAAHPHTARELRAVETLEITADVFEQLTGKLTSPPNPQRSGAASQPQRKSA